MAHQTKAGPVAGAGQKPDWAMSKAEFERAWRERNGLPRRRRRHQRVDDDAMESRDAVGRKHVMYPPPPRLLVARRTEVLGA